VLGDAFDGLELCWLVLSMGTLGLAGYSIRMAYLDRQIARIRAVREEVRLVAERSIWTERVRLLATIAILLVAFAHTHRTPPVEPILALERWCLLVLQFALTAVLILTIRTRRRLIQRRKSPRP
jgi:hypothetical protein